MRQVNATILLLKKPGQCHNTVNAGVCLTLGMDGPECYVSSALQISTIKFCNNAGIDGNYFPWKWRSFPFPSRSFPIPISTIGSIFIPFAWDSHGMPIPSSFVY